MTVEIKETKDNQLLGRKELIALVGFNGPTPKRADIKTEIAGKIGADPGLCVIRELKNEFGRNSVTVVLHSYEKLKKMKKIEPEYILVREGLMEKKKKEKKAKAAPAKKKQ